MTFYWGGRLLNIFDYALSSLRRKLLKNLAVLVIFTLVIFLLASFLLVSRALTEIARHSLDSTADITVQQLSAGRQTHIALASQDRLQDIPGIQRIATRIWGYYFDEQNGANYTVIGMPTRVGAEPPNSWTGLAEGRLPSADERGKAVLSNSVRDLLRLDGRKFFSLFRPDLTLAAFETVGIFNTQTELVTADTILMSEDDARDLFHIPEGLVTDLLVYSGNPLETDTIAGKIRERLPGVRVITKAQIQKTYQVVFSWRSGLGTICLLAALAAFIILAWDKASGLSQEELREIGILKILGWQTGDLILLRFLESSVIALCAFLIGSLLAWGHVVYFAGGLFRPIFLGWSVLRPSFTLVPPFVISDAFLVFAISVLPFLLATAVPAWRSAVVRADTVI